jgi:hypothetical protein
LPAIAASGQEAGVPLIAGTPWDVIQADLSATTKPDAIVIKGMHAAMSSFREPATERVSGRFALNHPASAR